MECYQYVTLNVLNHGNLKREMLLRAKHNHNHKVLQFSLRHGQKSLLEIILSQVKVLTSEE